MQSEIDSPCRLNFSSRCRVSASIGICQLPFDKRRSGCRNGAGAPTIRMRMRHSSVISISGITYGSQDGSPRMLTRAGCWPHESAPIARSGRMSQLNRGNAGIRRANWLARLDRGGEHDVGRESGVRTKSDIPPVLMLDSFFHKNLLRQHEYEPILFSSAEAFGNHGDFDRVVCVLLGRLLRWHLGRPMPALPVN
jgi:hypothetical protein